MLLTMFGCVLQELLEQFEQQKEIVWQCRNGSVQLFVTNCLAQYSSLNSGTQGTNILLSSILLLLLKLQFGMLGMQSMRQLITLFISERTESYRQYQRIMGMSHIAHTLYNLLYMCLMMGLYLLPVLAVLMYYQFRVSYVFNCMVFVVAACTMTLTISAFFKDFKIALEINGTVFSLTAFLVFGYHGNDGNIQGYQYTALDYFAMIMPNSAFTIATLQNNILASFLSLAMSIVYVCIYLLKQHSSMCWKIVRGWLMGLRKLIMASKDQLMQEFELNEIVSSDLEVMSSLNPLITVQGLLKTYTIDDQTYQALNGISLHIQRKQIFALLGRNGAGKTTLVDILTGVTEKTSGHYEILFKNNAPSFGICYQQEVLYELMTVDQHLYFYACIKNLLEVERSIQEQVDEAIGLLGLEIERQKTIKELSGGNRRKVSIAIAILGWPQVLIFDEPTSGLDPLSRINVWKIFVKLRANHESTILLTTHHLDEAEKLADDICVIDHGNVIAQGTASSIKNKYGKGYYLALRNGGLGDKYMKILERQGLKVEQVDANGTMVKYFLKMQKLEDTEIQFQQKVLQGVQALEQSQPGIKIYLQANNLQQSFISMLSQQSNDSIDFRVHVRDIPLDQQHICFKLFKQLWGIILKNVYYHKSQLFQSMLLYNINIFMLVISMMFTRYLSNAIDNQNAANGNRDHDIGQGQSKSFASIVFQGYFILPTAFIGQIVIQKQKRIRQVLNTRGVNGIIYWFGHFIFDYSCFTLNFLIVSRLLASQIMLQFRLGQILLMGISLIFYTYCLSFCFNKVKTTATWFTLINVLTGFAMTAVLMIPELHFLRWGIYLHPLYDMAVVVMQMPDQQIGQWSILFYGFLLVCLEISVIKRCVQCIQREQDEYVNANVKLINVNKQYKEVIALQNVSYEVESQIISLLGHNGAGKSTTFGLLSAQIHANSGKVHIEHRLKHRSQKTLCSTGICYQQDALWEGMTVKEIMQIMSWLVPIANSSREFKWLFNNIEFQVSNYDKRFQQLSGGNKRKLCLAVALYGSPELRLLDECSTGLDPSSRQAMLDTIKQCKQGCTIFTTHSMSEAETLCGKAVIMRKGEVIEYDSIDNLKQKYFDCSWMDLELEEKWEDNIGSLKKKLSAVGLNIVSQEKNVVRVAVEKNLWKMSDILRFVRQLQDNGIILGYRNNEVKLVDVYLKVTQQPENM